MSHFESHWISDHIVRIMDAAHTASYLTLGEERAMLIDTGIGLGILKAYVEHLTDLSYEVLLTHGHVDHASGAAEFSDRRVYLHPADCALMAYHTALPVRVDYLERMGAKTIGQDAFVESLDPERTVSIKHGDCFDLGGLTLEVIHAPGHTHGMCMILMPEERTILFGDGCGENVMLIDDEATSVEEYLQTLMDLKSYEDRYDRILRNHGTCVSPKSLLDNVIEACKTVVAGTDDHFQAPPGLLPVDGDGIFFAKALDLARHGRADGKRGNVAYHPRKVYRP